MATMTVPIITISGRHLYQGDTPFVVRGIVYQSHSTLRKSSGMQDPISDDQFEKLDQDIGNLKELGLNALWIYYIDPLLSHDACMKLLAENGIYIVVVMSSNRQAINRLNPRQSYTPDLRQRFQDVVDCLSVYPNVIGVCVANSLINNQCRKLGLIHEICEVISTAIGDLKDYMDSQHAAKGQRILPICISDDAWALFNSESFEYLAETGVDRRPERGLVDFYCFTHYGPTKDLVKYLWTRSDEATPIFERLHLHSKFQDMKRVLPILCSEYSDGTGSRPRHFDKVRELYSSSEHVPSEDSDISSMLDVFSGGFVYEYYEGPNAYGLMKEEHDGALRKLPDFYSFKKEMLATL